MFTSLTGKKELTWQVSPSREGNMGSVSILIKPRPPLGISLLAPRSSQWVMKWGQGSRELNSTAAQLWTRNDKTQVVRSFLPRGPLSHTLHHHVPNWGEHWGHPIMEEESGMFIPASTTHHLKLKPEALHHHNTCEASETLYLCWTFRLKYFIPLERVAGTSNPQFFPTCFKKPLF